MSREKCIFASKRVKMPLSSHLVDASGVVYFVIPTVALHMRRHRKNISSLLCFGAFVCGCSVASTPDAREIMQRSIAAIEKNSQASHTYAFASRVEKHELDPAGHVRSKDAKTYDAVIIDGVAVQRLMAHNDRPLSAEEDRRESERVWRLVNERKRETERQKSKRLAEVDQQLAKELAFNRELLTAFDFKLSGEEQIDGRAAWRIDATPRAGYQPKEMRAQMLPHFKGTVWVDEREYLWLRVNAEAIDAVTVGFFLLRLEPGARVAFSQVRLDDGVCLPRSSSIKAQMRVGLLKKINLDQNTVFTNHRKLPPGVSVVAVRPDER